MERNAAEIMVQTPAKSQGPQVTAMLQGMRANKRRSLTINEAAVLCECSRQQVEYYADLGEIDMERRGSGRYYVDFKSLMNFLGETAQ